MRSMKRNTRKKGNTRKKRKPVLGPSTPLIIWSVDHMVRVGAGKRVCQLSGRRRGRLFLVDANQPLHWGLGSGPRLTDTERTLLIQRVETTSQHSPWLRIRFPPMMGVDQ